MKIRIGILIAVAVLLVVVVMSVLFTVDQAEYAVVTQFGRPVKTILEPGLNWKLPDPIQTVWRSDKRLKVYTPPVSELLTRDKKNVMVECFVTWRVAQPLIYMKTLKNFSYAQDRLHDVVFSELGVSLGQRDLNALISLEKDSIKMPEMMENVLAATNGKLTRYGIEIKDIRLKTLKFPEKNQQSVFERMRAEREKMARLYRSQGTEESSKIRAVADRDKSMILSAAYEKAEKMKGEGDAQAIKIYAQAFQKDPKFYEFVRSLEAYEKLIDEKTTVILPSNANLLKYLEKVK